EGAAHLEEISRGAQRDARVENMSYSGSARFCHPGWQLKEGGARHNCYDRYSFTLVQEGFGCGKGCRMAADLADLVERIRTSPGVRGKSAIGVVSEVFQNSDWLTGPGDDGAVVQDSGGCLVVGGEAILPSFVAADPYGAGIAAVLTNVNDLAAMGAR